MSQSAVHTPSRLDESLTSAQFDPLSQSMRVESTDPRVGGSPSKSIRGKLGRFIAGMFTKEDSDEASAGKKPEANEDYIELFMTDANGLRTKRGVVGPGVQKVVVGGSPATQEAQGTLAVGIEGGRSIHHTLDNDDSDDRDRSGRSDSPVNSHRRSGMGEARQLEASDSVEVDISTPPPIYRVSRSDSETSQSSANQFDFRQMNDSPNTAGAGNFDTSGTGCSYKDFGASATTETVGISSSYPRCTALQVARAGKGHGRSHSSNSETEISHHAHQLQERLQRLVEHKEPPGGGSMESSTKGSVLDSHTPVLEGSGPHPDPLYPQGHAPHPTRLTMRRLSVCSRRGLGLRFTSESSSSGCGATTVTSTQHDPRDPQMLVLSGHPSPLALLDQFVSCGEVLHRGNLDSLPLTEQEGVDWTHFGGCPHSEEFRIMQSQVVLLHSQLLFERYQCVQHAKRNRRLLSKARSAAHVTEELVSLVSLTSGLALALDLALPLA